MKAHLKSNYIPLVILGAGLLGAALRSILYAVGFDEKGLLRPGHPLHILCWVLVLAVPVFLAVSLRKLDGSDRYEDNFPAAPQGLSAVILTTLWFLSNAFSALDQISDKFDLLAAVFGFLAVPCFAYTGYCRIKGKRPHFLFHTVVCLFFAMDLVCHYRRWSGDPQFADYCFQLFACIFLLLTAYQHTAFDVDMGRRQAYLFCSLMAAFLCILSFAGPGDTFFYFGGAVWTISGLCPLALPGQDGPGPEQEGV